VELLYLVFTGWISSSKLCVCARARCVSNYWFFASLLLTFDIIFLELSFKAMIIIAWNGSGKLSSIFEGDVFKRVLSIFITAAILKLAQGELVTRFSSSGSFVPSCQTPWLM